MSYLCTLQLLGHSQDKIKILRTLEADSQTATLINKVSTNDQKMAGVIDSPLQVVVPVRFEMWVDRVALRINDIFIGVEKPQLRV